jgi:2-polyprenyl-3-methyl-5-hydroxy-6-metoxy-1,4-benzoquinol methylase
MNPVEAKQLVQSGYDQISYEYRADRYVLDDSDYELFLELLDPYLPPHAEILELGCGCGVPVARTLAEEHRVLGIDCSSVQIERARSLVPNAEFRQADMTEVAFDPNSFDAVIAFYSIIHVPVAEQPELFVRIASWLRPDGVFIATVGTKTWTGTEADWNGAPMYWSHADRETYIRWISEAGLVVENEEYVAEGHGGHTLLLARKPS